MDESWADEEWVVGVGNPKEEEEVGNLAICSVGSMSRSLINCKQLSRPQVHWGYQVYLVWNLVATGVDSRD